MYLHSLTMSNIGPFVGESTVDFATLSKAGLFLLEGPTGAGKSTVLDAIVFALYGSLATSAASTDRMRSDRAALGEDSFVDLVFEVNRGIYRVRRNPSYERPKKSGSGTTVQKSAVTVWRLSSPDDAVGTVLSSRSGEADAELLKAIGLTRAQFVQTVLLPQGEFAAFLRASPTERQTLLQRLFGTELYNAMSLDLEQRRREAQLTRSKAQSQLDQAITVFVTAAELSDQSADAVRAAAVADLPALTAGIVAEAKVAYDQSRSVLAKQATAMNEARRLLQFGQDHNKLVARFVELAARSSALANGAATQKSRKQRQTLLAAAIALLPYHQALLDATEQLERLDGRVVTLRQALIDGGHTKWLEDPAEAAETLEKEMRELAPAAAAAQRQQELKANLDAIALRRESAAEHGRKLTARLALVPDSRRDCLAKIQEAQSAAANLDLLDERRTAAEARLVNAQAATALQQVVDAEAIHVEELRVIARKAETHRSAVQRARIDGIASELANALVPDEPCPVCGSTTHPAPAESAADHVDQAAVEEAHRAASTAFDQLEAVANALAARRTELAAFLAKTDGASVAECERSLTEAKAAHALALEQQAVLVDQRVELDHIERRADELVREHAMALKEMATAEEQQQSVRSQVEAASAEIEIARGEFPTVSARIEHLDQLIKRLRDLSSAGSLAHSQTEAVARHRAAWEQQLAESPLSDAAEFVVCLQASGELPALNREIEIYEAEHQFVTQSLAGPEFAALGPEPVVTELTPLSEALAEHEAAHSIATQEVGLHQNRCEAATRAQESLLEALEGARSTIEQTQDAIRLADIVNATSPENLLRMPLPTYVLVSRFKDVLAAANDRLATMSDGRYAIEYTESLESHGRKSGLGISILDRHTEKSRQAGDLSGGETFYTALALALGLADVVVQEAGGVELGTLFIDEGFGSLDTETLDSVLAEIAHLRAGGRAVGVVSHVDELKQRISERIEVRRSGAGTSTLNVIA
ncbi:MAG: SMC family ATPase [Candidatus Nanopelagicales bacterium]